MNKNKIEKLINSGLSQREIALKLGIGQTTLRYWLSKFGLSTKHKQCNKLDRSEKICSKCKELKPLDDFYGRTSYCKICSNAYHTDRVRKVKLRMVEYKGGKCLDCPRTIKNTHYSAFDFHHLNPEEKDINFEKIKYQKWEKIEAELNKCVLLCATCHRIRTAEINGW
jgi:predicted transcriptional regulator